MSKSNPTLSVVLGMYKENVSAVSAILKNLREQTYPADEIIVVVDNPNNIAVKQYLNHEATIDRKLTVIHNTKNIGLGASLNKAVRVAKGELLARTDLEDWSEPERFLEQINYFRNHPDADLVFTQWQEHYEDNTKKDRLPTSAQVQDIKRNFFVKSILLHPTLVIRREILEHHPYPEMDRPEDFVLFLKLIRLNYHFDTVEKVLYHYQVDRRERYEKTKIYSENLLPQLFKMIPYFIVNPYFYLYLIRISAEYAISRNKFVYDNMNATAARIWRIFF